METFLKSKALHYTCTSTVENYALIICPHKLSEKLGNEISNREGLDELRESGYSLGYIKDNIRYVWNNSKREKFLQDEASAWYEIHICLDDMDLDHVKEYETTCQKWTALLEKYQKIRPASNRETTQKLTNFKFEPDESLEAGWTRIKEYRRRISQTNPNLATAYDENSLFDFFIQALPSSYKIVRQSIDSQPYLTMSDKFDILLGVEDEIRHSKEKDTALAARTQGRGRGKLQNRGYR
ncbi:hypothetical protein K3495_g16367, partial [Podosphaera aphanis]